MQEYQISENASPDAVVLLTQGCVKGVTIPIKIVKVLGQCVASDLLTNTKTAQIHQFTLAITMADL